VPRVSLVVLAVLLLSACSGRPPTAAPAHTSNEGAATPTSMPQPSVTVAPTLSPRVEPSIYEDSWLCFSVGVPAGWTTDGVPGGFASFAPATGQPSFRITNVALEPPTLAQALAEVQRGPLGSHVQEVKDFVVDGQPALWVTFAPGAEFQFVVLVIAPDCGDGSHTLFISAAEADQKSFETFLNYIRFIQGRPVNPFSHPGRWLSPCAYR
jgi:hypothetical protein